MSELNHTLTSQLFEFTEGDNHLLEQVLQQAKAFAALDNSIVVVSDFRYGHCYIFAGSFGQQFGLISNSTSGLTSHSDSGLTSHSDSGLTVKRSNSDSGLTFILDTGSAFEDCLFSHFHPDDEKERQRLELNYLRFIQTIPLAERLHYNTSCIIRIQNQQGSWQQVHYRVHYKASHPNGSVWLAVCFYSPAYIADNLGGVHQGYACEPRAIRQACIINNLMGEVVMQSGGEQYPNISLTKREKEILRLIGTGLASKQIADQLCISEHTVNRHRQNIIERLGVSNTAQALHAAHLIGAI